MDSADIGFEEQIKLEEQERERSARVDGTQTDSDGVSYEWDASRNAWFPKIDNDFIAQYQMNYGSSETETQQPDGNQQVAEDAGLAAQSNESEQNDGENSDTENTEYTEEDYQKYVEYYKYYYGDDYEQHMHYDHYYQQMPQGHEDTPQEEEEGKVDKKEEESKKEKGKRKAQPEEDRGWFEIEDKNNTNVYVTGLPFTITDEEYKELMSKCGMIMHDPRTRKEKLKLYRDENGQPKGDGTCCYIKSESVDLALKILDGYNFNGKNIHVEQATYTLKGDYDPSKRKKLSNKQKKKIKMRQEKLFDWQPELQSEGRSKNEKVVVLKSMFELKDFENDPTQINTLRLEVTEECSKFGEVKKVTVHDRNVDGAVTVMFSEPEEADACINTMNGRWFAKRKLSAETWDGKTKYDVIETETQREERIKKWDKYLAGTDSSDSGKKPKDSDSVLKLPSSDKNSDKDNKSQSTSETPQVNPDSKMSTDQVEQSSS